MAPASDGTSRAGRTLSFLALPQPRVSSAAWTTGAATSSAGRSGARCCARAPAGTTWATTASPASPQVGGEQAGLPVGLVVWRQTHCFCEPPEKRASAVSSPGGTWSVRVTRGGLCPVPGSQRIPSGHFAAATMASPSLSEGRGLGRLEFQGPEPWAGRGAGEGVQGPEGEPRALQHRFGLCGSRC